MNWYKIFYWVTVADGVKMFFNVFAVMFTIFFVLTTIFYIVSTGSTSSNAYNKESKDYKEWLIWSTTWKKLWRVSIIVMIASWAGYVFTPTKRDAIVIIAGGAVGNFITSDSSSRQIPAELTLLIREKMRSEIEEVKTGFKTETLKEKTKEELIEIIKNKK